MARCRKGNMTYCNTTRFTALQPALRAICNAIYCPPVGWVTRPTSWLRANFSCSCHLSVTKIKYCWNAALRLIHRWYNAAYLFGYYQQIIKSPNPLGHFHILWNIGRTISRTHDMFTNYHYIMAILTRYYRADISILLHSLLHISPSGPHVFHYPNILPLA